MRGELYMVVVKVVEEGVPKTVGISIVLFLMELIQTLQETTKKFSFFETLDLSVGL